MVRAQQLDPELGEEPLAECLVGPHAGDVYSHVDDGVDLRRAAASTTASTSRAAITVVAKGDSAFERLPHVEQVIDLSLIHI